MKTRWACVLGLATVCAATPGARAAEWITFDSPASLETENAGDADPVRAYLATPVEPGRNAGVVLLPTCAGQQPYHQSWARSLAARGYAALLVDHYFMHDRGSTCDGHDQVVDLQLRLRHAGRAARYLSQAVGVDAARIALMGWGDAPLEAVLAGSPALRPVAAVVAVTPDGCPREAARDVPWLALLASTQPASVAVSCVAPVLAVTYENTVPGFDDPRAGERRRRVHTGPARRYDRLAHAEAVDDVVSFLDRHLGPGDGATHAYSSASHAPPGQSGTWAVDPTDPGPDLPPEGVSTFDRVFSRMTPAGPAFELPFPFERLVERLDDAAGARRLGGTALEAALIPLGRSLQREAASPEYFASPRIVIAVTREPSTGPLPRVPLASRLFLGYQPRAGVIEAISYNEEAARFEFQVVHDYREGMTPRVRYARRALCTSCHQNGAPIFSQAAWDETNANRRVVSRLGGHGGAFHGIAVTEDDRGVASIDSATDEANLLPVLQLLWQRGCAGATPAETRACRAGAVQAMLQYRLSGGSGFDRGEPLYGEWYLPVQRASWRRDWPDGLLVPSSSLPDRSPLMQPIPSSVPVAQDPLRRRPPGQRWSAATPRDLERMVRGLSRTLPAQLVTHLDAHLRLVGSERRRTLGAPCSVLGRGMRARTIEVECKARGDAEDTFGLRATLREGVGDTIGGSAEWLDLPGGFYARLRARGTMTEDAGERSAVVVLSRRDGEPPVRAPSGDSIESLTLRWNARAAASGRRWPANGTLVITSDFDPVRGTLRRAADPGLASPLAMRRFDARALASWVLEALGAAPSEPCCAARREPTPPPVAEATAATTDAALSDALEHLGPLRTFDRFCGACHGTDSRNPPGFLHGDPSTRRGAVEHCAERIYYRLSMWHRPPEERGAPPMPPEQGLRLADTDARDWQHGPSLARLIDYVEKVLETQGARPAHLLAGEYRDTSPCLPAPGTTAAH